jgi:hypothetical protein
MWIECATFDVYNIALFLAMSSFYTADVLGFQRRDRHAGVGSHFVDACAYIASGCFRCCTKGVEERFMGSSVEEGRMTEAMPVGGVQQSHDRRTTARRNILSLRCACMELSAAVCMQMERGQTNLRDFSP